MGWRSLLLLGDISTNAIAAGVSDKPDRFPRLVVKALEATNRAAESFDRIGKGLLTFRFPFKFNLAS